MAVLLLLIALSAFAEENHVRVLVPIAVTDVPGAYGSRWSSELWVRNQGEHMAYFYANEPCAFLCPTPMIDPGYSRRVVYYRRPPHDPGYFMYLGTDADLAFNLRIQDLSRQALTWGTEVPLVREHEFTSQPISLLNVPLDDRFRQMVRIYALEQVPGLVARMQIRRRGDDAVLASADLALDYAGDPVGVPYVQVGDLVERFPNLRGHEGITIEIAPVGAGIHLWAFASITNNLTQHVTLITPQ